jgi:uncharacterized Zn finger protein (UPF0148 family)
MGLLRWAAIIGTGGLAPVKGTAPRERTAKAAEKQVRLQQQALKAQQASSPRLNVTCPKCSAALVSPPGNNIKCPKCGFRMKVWALENQPAAQQPATQSTVSETPGARAAAAAAQARAQALAAGASAPEAQAAATHAADVIYRRSNRDTATNENGAENVSGELGRLADLHERGALTDEEFAAAKAKALGTS